MSTPRLVKHELLRKLSEVGGLSESDQARACGYAGKASNRVQTSLFKQAIDEANLAIEFDFAIRLWLGSGAGTQLLGKPENLQLSQPALAERLLTEPDQCNVGISVFIKTVERDDTLISDVSFAVASESSAEGETIKLLSNIKNPAALAVDALTAAQWPDGPQSLEFAADLEAFLSTPWAKHHSSLLTRMLAALLFSHEAIHNPKWENFQIGRINPPDAIQQFLPSRGLAKVIAGETPYFDSIYEEGGAGDYVLPKKMVKSILSAKQLANVSTYRMFPCNGDKISIPSWTEIDESLEEYLYGDLEGRLEEGDCFTSKILLEIKDPYLFEMIDSRNPPEQLTWEDFLVSTCLRHVDRPGVCQ